jgi:hypothetical protein
MSWQASQSFVTGLTFMRFAWDDNENGVLGDFLQTGSTAPEMIARTSLEGWLYERQDRDPL